MAFAIGSENACNRLEADLRRLLLDATKLGAEEVAFENPAPRRLKTAGPLTSPFNSESLRLLSALATHVESRLASIERPTDRVKDLLDQLEILTSRIDRELARQRPV